MTLQTYCSQTLTRHLYFHWIKIYIPCEAAQNGLLAILTIQDALQKIPLLSKEVIPKKLLWWREEISLFLEKKPRHPATKCLLESQPKIIWHEKYLLDLIEATWFSIDQVDAIISFEWLKSIAKLQGSSLSLMSMILKVKNEAQLNQAQNIGAFVFLIETLQNPRWFMLNGYDRELLLKNLSHQLPHTHCIPFINMLRRYYLALLAQMKKNDYNALQEKIVLSPWYTHWIFYKARKEAKKLNEPTKALTR